MDKWPMGAAVMPAPTPPPGFTLNDPDAARRPSAAMPAGVPQPPPGYTFNEAMADQAARTRPGGRLDVRAGEELLPGTGLPGSPFYQRPMVAPAPVSAEDANFGVAFKSGLVEDEETQKRIIAESLFPGDPRGLERVGLYQGKPVFVNDQGVLQYVSGPYSQLAAGAAVNAPEMALGTVGSFAASPIAGSTIGATGGRAWKRVAANLIFDEPQTPLGNAADLGKEAAANLVGGWFGQKTANLLDSSRMIDFTPRQIKLAEQSRQYIKDRTGVDLDLALASGDRKLIAVREYAGKFPGRAADLVQAQDEIMQGQFSTAVDRVLNMVAKAKPDEVAGQHAISAAEAALTLAKREVQQAVNPLYKAAYATATDITDPQILQLLELKDVQKAVEKARYTIALENRGVPKAVDRDPKTLEPILVDAVEPLSLEVLDLTKQHLDDRIEDLAKDDKRTAVALADVRDDIKKFLDNVSSKTVRARNPGETDKVISLYKQARAEYGRLYEEKITPLEDGAIGVLAKMHPQNAVLAANVLRRSGVTPEQIAILKGGLSRSNPEAYKGLVRLYLEQEWDAAQAVSQSGDVINPAGKFLASVFQTPKQRDRAVAMLPPQTAQVLEDVMLAAEKLAKTPIGSSRQPGPTTARDQIITEQLKGRALSVLRWLIAPRQSIKDSAEQSALENGIEQLTEALIDPAKRSQLKQITRMKPSTQQALLLAGLLGGQSAGNVLESNTATQLPPVMVPAQ